MYLNDFQIRSFRHLFKSSRAIFYILSSVAIAERALSGVEESERNDLHIKMVSKIY